MLDAICCAAAAAINILVPPICLNCNSGLENVNELQLCNQCMNSIQPLPAGQCRCCAQPFVSKISVHTCGKCLHNPPCFTMTYAARRYRGSIKTAIQNLKYRSQLPLAKPLGTILCNVLGEDIIAYNPDCIIPVPLHKKRLRQRGYNQALEISRVISRRYELPLNIKTLQRCRWTQPQQGLSAKERRKNLRDAFTVTMSEPVRRVLLVDDVMTTGETMRACASTLISAGAEEVRAAAVGRA